MIDSLHRLTIGISSIINISKASWWILIKLYTQHYWAVGKVEYCFGQVGLELWLPRQHVCFNGKNIKKIFSETTRFKALIFGVWQWLIVLYIKYGIHAPGAKFCQAKGSIVTIDLLLKENLQTPHWLFALCK